MRDYIRKRVVDVSLYIVKPTPLCGKRLWFSG